MGMVENQNKIEQKLSARDHDEIRFLLYCGLSVRKIAMRLGATYEATVYRVRTYRLSRPVGALEAVKLEMLTAFRETNRRLAKTDLSDAEHARLCAVQVKQALALARFMPPQENLEEENMSLKSDAARQRILAMSDEEAFDELRSVAGLENKSADPCDAAIPGGGEPSIVQPFPDEGEPCTKAAAGEGVADMDVSGRAWRGEDKGGG